MHLCQPVTEKKNRSCYVIGLNVTRHCFADNEIIFKSWFLIPSIIAIFLSIPTFWSIYPFMLLYWESGCQDISRSYSSGCLVRQGSGRPTDRVYVNCPCVKPLNCRSTGMRDIPLGEVGV